MTEKVDAYIDAYQEFLKRKIVKVHSSGIDICIDDIHPYLFDWQKEVVVWALRLGKAALFESTGLGKTIQQLEWAKHVITHSGGKVLICAPLAVAHQTIREGKKIDLEVQYVRHQTEVEASINQLFITNYDMLKEFNASKFSGIVLDESSILKSFSGATKRLILSIFEHTTYKLACTATPSPNDHLELGNHAEFLNVMRSNEMIQKFFINDTMSAGAYRLKHHAEKDFWQWVTSWAVCISKPSDIGYPDTTNQYTYNLPELNIYNQIVSVDHSRAFDDGKLFLTDSLSATSMWKEKAMTAEDRCNKASEIIGSNNDYWIIWCDTNQEADILTKLFPDAVEVRGSHSIPQKEKMLSFFSDGGVKKIITKSDIAGFGLNWQHCANQIFVGVSYSFEKLFQSLRRSWRFGQTKPVNAYLVYSETEGDIMKIIKEKQKAHDAMQEAMNNAMRENGFNCYGEKYKTKFEIETADEAGKNWKMMLGDCCTRIKEIEDNSIDFTIYSPPFSNLYIYSDSIADMGNSANMNEFMEHYKYLVKELLRVTLPGRLAAVHCKDLPLYHNRDGVAGLIDFPGILIRAHEKFGWVFHSRITVWKDPVVEMQRTKNHGLLHKNFTVRSEVTRQGMADYVIVFRKWDGVERTESPFPVKHDYSSVEKYIGSNPPERWDSEREYTIQIWQRYASPVWFDIRQMNVLNFQMARDSEDEKHICPLQLDVIERCIQLWTNPGELVFSPFAGIGSEGVSALKLKRKFIGIELKKSYWQYACKYLAQIEFENKSIDLFQYAGMNFQ